MSTTAPKEYKFAALPRGQRGHLVASFTGGVRDEEVLWLPQGTPAETQFEILTAIQRAYRQGWEDRAGA